MFTPTTPYQRPLDGGFTIRSIADQADIDRLAAFNGQIFGEGVVGMTSALISQHPDTRPHHWLYVEEESTGNIVSSLGLIPWTWRYEDVTLKAGEMGIVGTLPAYRNRGLVRALVARHQETLREEDFALGIIQGIPYFYRQFGYEYALPLEAHWRVELDTIPTGSEAETYRFRQASPQDIPLLMRMYDDTTRPLKISAVRTAEIWQHLLGEASATEMGGETWLMLDRQDNPLAYCRIMHQGFGSGLIVSETARLNLHQAKSLLGWLKEIAIQRGKPYIRLNLPENNDLLRTARYSGAHDTGTYAWQIHIVDVPKLLFKLRPVLERRLSTSMLAGLSQKVVINLYREAFELDFQEGQLLAVKPIGYTEGGQIRLPPHLLTPLVLGYRSREELRAAHPDVAIWGDGQYLVDVLFPKMDGFIFTIY